MISNPSHSFSLLPQTPNPDIGLFKRRLFSSDLMTLIVTGPQDANLMTLWVQNLFRILPDRKVRSTPINVPFFSKYGQVVRTFTEDVLKFITIVVETPKGSASDFVFEVLGDQGPGGFFQKLKSENLAFFLQTSLMVETKESSLYSIKIASQSINFYRLLEELLKFVKMMSFSENLEARYDQFLKIRAYDIEYQDEIDVIQQSYMLFDQDNTNQNITYVISVLNEIKIDKIQIIFDADARKFNRLKKQFSKDVVQKALRLLEQKKKKNQEFYDFQFQFYDDMNIMIGQLPDSYLENLSYDKLKVQESIFLRNSNFYLIDNFETLKICQNAHINEWKTIEKDQIAQNYSQNQDFYNTTQNETIVQQTKEISPDWSQDDNIQEDPEEKSNQIIIQIQNSTNLTQMQATDTQIEDQILEQIKKINDIWKLKLFHQIFPTNITNSTNQNITVNTSQNLTSKGNISQTTENKQGDQEKSKLQINQQILKTNDLVDSIIDKISTFQNVSHHYFSQNNRTMDHSTLIAENTIEAMKQQLKDVLTHTIITYQSHQETQNITQLLGELYYNLTLLKQDQFQEIDKINEQMLLESQEDNNSTLTEIKNEFPQNTLNISLSSLNDTHINNTQLQDEGDHNQMTNTTFQKTPIAQIQIIHDMSMHSNNQTLQASQEALEDLEPLQQNMFNHSLHQKIIADQIYQNISQIQNQTNKTLSQTNQHEKNDKSEQIDFDIDRIIEEHKHISKSNNTKSEKIKINNTVQDPLPNQTRIFQNSTLELSQDQEHNHLEDIDRLKNENFHSVSNISHAESNLNTSLILINHTLLNEKHLSNNNQYNDNKIEDIHIDHAINLLKQDIDDHQIQNQEFFDKQQNNQTEQINETVTTHSLNLTSIQNNTNHLINQTDTDHQQEIDAQEIEFQKNHTKDSTRNDTLIINQTQFDDKTEHQQKKIDNHDEKTLNITEIQKEHEIIPQNNQTSLLITLEPHHFLNLTQEQKHVDEINIQHNDTVNNSTFSLNATISHQETQSQQEIEHNSTINNEIKHKNESENQQIQEFQEDQKENVKEQQVREKYQLDIEEKTQRLKPNPFFKRKKQKSYFMNLESLMKNNQKKSEQPYLKVLNQPIIKLEDKKPQPININISVDKPSKVKKQSLQMDLNGTTIKENTIFPQNNPEKAQIILNPKNTQIQAINKTILNQKIEQKDENVQNNKLDNLPKYKNTQATIQTQSNKDEQFNEKFKKLEKEIISQQIKNMQKLKTTFETNNDKKDQMIGNQSIGCNKTDMDSCKFRQTIPQQQQNHNLTNITQIQQNETNIPIPSINNSSKIELNQSQPMEPINSTDIQHILKQLNNSMIYDLVKKHLKSHNVTSQLKNQTYIQDRLNNENDYLNEVFTIAPLLNNSVITSNIGSYQNVTYDLEKVRKTETPFTFIDPKNFQVDSDGLTEDLIEIAKNQVRAKKHFKKGIQALKNPLKSLKYRIQESEPEDTLLEFLQLFQMNQISDQNDCISPQTNSKTPGILYTKNESQIWHLFNNNFAKAGVFIQLDYGIDTESAKIFSWVLQDLILSEFQDAIHASYDIEIQSVYNLIEIKVQGFSQKILQLFKQILEFIKGLEIDQDNLSRYIFYFNNHIDISPKYLANQQLMKILQNKKNEDKSEINFDIEINRFDFQCFFMGNLAEEQILKKFNALLFSQKQKISNDNPYQKLNLKGKSFVSRQVFQDPGNYLMNYYQLNNPNITEIAQIQILLTDLNKNEQNYQLFETQNEDKRYSKKITFHYFDNGIVVENYNPLNPHVQDYIIEQYLQIFENRLRKMTQEQFIQKKQRLKQYYTQYQPYKEKMMHFWRQISQNLPFESEMHKTIDNFSHRSYLELFQHMFKGGKLSVQLFGSQEQMVQEVYMDYQSYVGIDSILI